MTNATSIEDLFRRLNDASVDVAQSAVRSLSIEEDATNGLLSQYLERSPLGAELLSIWQASGDHRGVCMHCARLSHYVLHRYETGSLRPNRASDFGDSVCLFSFCFPILYFGCSAKAGPHAMTIDKI
jgi:hypothetical protein